MRLLLANTIVFLATVLAGGGWSPDIATLIAAGALHPPSLEGGEYWRLVTVMFLHGGIIHFAVNSYALYVLGSSLEPVLKGRRFLPLYFIAGIFASLASATWTSQTAVGASGAIFGLLGAGLLIEQLSNYKGLNEKPQNTCFVYTILNLAIGFAIPNIDMAAHLGGLLAGVLCMWGMLHLSSNKLVCEA